MTPTDTRDEREARTALDKCIQDAHENGCDHIGTVNQHEHASVDRQRDEAEAELAALREKAAALDRLAAWTAAGVRDDLSERWAEVRGINFGDGDTHQCLLSDCAVEDHETDKADWFGHGPSLAAAIHAALDAASPPPAQRGKEPRG